MELRQIRTFQKVATLGSFNLAADVLHYAQSTVSAQIKGLEEDLGVQLFDRIGKTIALTEAGESLLKHSQKLLAIADQTQAAVTGGTDPGGVLSIRAPQTIATHYLPKLMLSFQKRCPTVSIDISSCTAYRLAQQLRTGTIDLAFLMTESILSQDLKTQLLGIDHLIWVTSLTHPLTNKKGVDLNDIENQRVLIPKTDCDYPLRLKKMLLAERIKPLALPEFNSIQAIIESVKIGLGIALLPSTAVTKEIAAGELAGLPWKNGPMETGVFMIWHKQKWLSPALSAFLEIAKNN